MAFSRADWLQQKLTETGHEAEQRIKWEVELASCIDRPFVTKKKPSFIRYSDFQLKWNEEVLKGWKYQKYRHYQLPGGYYIHHGFILPPYLRAAFKRMRHGETVFGMTSLYWYNSKASANWASKTGKNQIESNEISRKEYEKALDQFFKLAPVVSYAECQRRFSASALKGNVQQEERAREKAYHSEQKKKEKKQAKEQAKECRLAKERQKAKVDPVARDGWERAEAALAKRKAQMADQKARVAAGEAAFIAKHGLDVIAYGVKQATRHTVPQSKIQRLGQIISQPAGIDAPRCGDSFLVELTASGLNANRHGVAYCFWMSPVSHATLFRTTGSDTPGCFQRQCHWA